MFALVGTPVAFWVFFVIAAYYNLDINQKDIKIAFLYDFIDQLIYKQKAYVLTGWVAG